MQKTKNKIPPYVSFKTFQTFLEFLSEGMPNRIDRSVWLNKFSGSNGTQIMTAIKFFELIVLLLILISFSLRNEA